MKFLSIGNAKRVAVVVGVVAVAAVSSGAHAVATLDPAIATAITGVTDQFGLLMPLLYGAMGLVTGGLVIFGLSKKGIKKVA